jgi:hypothetical protein
VVEVCRPGAFAGTHPGDLPLLALPLVAVSPARWATPPGRTCATVSRASTSERATTPGLPFPRVVARTGPGALVQPGLRADGVPPRCSGDHTPIHRHTKERQRRHRRYGPAMAFAAKAEQWKDDSRVEGHRRFVCASGGWRNPMALLVAARVVCRSGCRTIRRTRWSLGDSASFRQRACVPKSHPAIGEPALGRLRTGWDPSKRHDPGDVSASLRSHGPDRTVSPPWKRSHRPTEARPLPSPSDRQTGERPRPW